MLPDIIEKIYVINLKHCTERKKHIINEFGKVNINSYEFFTALPKDSNIVKDLIKTEFVKKFPPCFRCYQNECDCENNILIKSQIGNWCSFIKLINNIIKKDFKKLIMICEDDIKFTEIGISSIQKLINKKSLNKNNIFLNKPILIRLGKGYCEDHKLNVDPYFLKNDENPWANPCFIINVEFAKLFKKHLIHIYTTSDVYIHRFLLEIEPEIQAVTVMPLPIYELSYNEEVAIFPSEIHPKGINEIDKKKTINTF